MAKSSDEPARVSSNTCRFALTECLLSRFFRGIDAFSRSVNDYAGPSTRAISSGVICKFIDKLVDLSVAVLESLVKLTNHQGSAFAFSLFSHLRVCSSFRLACRHPRSCYQELL